MGGWVRNEEEERKQARRRFLEGVFNQNLVVHKLSGLSASTYRDFKRHKIPCTATPDGGAPPTPALCGRVRGVQSPCPTPSPQRRRRRSCAFRFQVLDLYSTRSLGAGAQCMRFYLGPGVGVGALTPLCTLRTHPGERKKKKSVPSSRVCGFEVFRACLWLARVGK